MHTYYCPTFGSTVGWNLDLRPNQFDVRSDFQPTEFPPPVQSIWEEEMCALWATLPADILHFPRGRHV